LRSGGDLDDLVSRTDLALPEHAQVEAGAMMGHEQRGHARLVHAQANPVAGDPWLRDLELRAADPVAIADAHLVVRQAVDREVLAEVSVREIVPAELPLPVAVRLDLVDQDRTLL